MENQNSSYSVQIGKTTFIVCVKQSETCLLYTSPSPRDA